MEFVGQRQFGPMRFRHIRRRGFKHWHFDLARLIPPPRPLPPTDSTIALATITTTPAARAFTIAGTLILTLAGLSSIGLLRPLLHRRAERLAQVTAIIFRPPVDGDDDVLIRGGKLMEETASRSAIFPQSGIL